LHEKPAENAAYFLKRNQQPSKRLKTPHLNAGKCRRSCRGNAFKV